MILDLNYDKSLWLMMSVNKNNREKIINFIESVPNELLIKLRNGLKEYNNSKFYSNKNKKLYGEINNGEEYLYHFNLDAVTGELVLGRSTYQYGVYFKDFEIKINPIISDNHKLGEVSFDYRNVVTNDVIFTGDKTTYVYDMINFGTKKLVIASEKDKVGLNVRLNLVDKIPNDYDVKLLKRVK